MIESLEAWQSGFARLLCVVVSGIIILAGFIVLWILLVSALNAIKYGTYQDIANQFYQMMIIVLVAWVVGGLFMYACSRKSRDIYYRP